MRFGVVLVGLLGGAGCNQLFGLEPPGDDVMVDANPLDQDSDGILDEDDNCPAHANRLQSDEDHDAAINGGDACDLCPHSAAINPGDQHQDLDEDGLGDDCDPAVAVRHCLRWFDGFADEAPGDVLTHYALSGGAWRVADGHLVQSDAMAVTAQAVIADHSYGAALVATTGRFDDLPLVGAFRNTAGVVAAASADGIGTCFGSVSRDVNIGMPQPAKTVLAHRSQVNEVVDAEATFPKGDVPLVVGERFGAILDVHNTSTEPVAVGALFDQGLGGLVVSAPLGCAAGATGVRTSFAAVSFEYVMVIEQPNDQDRPCPPREPLL